MIATPDKTGFVVPSPIFQDHSLADSAIQFIQNHLWLDTHSEDDFAVSVTAAKFVLETVSRDPTIMGGLLLDQGTEVYKS